MQLTIAPGDMKALETAYMAETGVAGCLLMEHAATAVTDALRRHVEPAAAVLFLCGPGNNGGDGYAAARLWQASGGSAVIWELSDHPSGDAGINRLLALQAGIPVRTLTGDPGLFPPVGAVVDALFGTGLSRPLQGIAAELVSAMNRCAVPVISVDIPSGLDGETGRVLGCAVHAAETVTFHRVKTGLLLGEGCVHSGTVTAAPILIPEGWGHADGLRWMEDSDWASLIPARRPDAHKGTFGRVTLMVGREGMAGAAAFCARACVKAGAGLTTILCRSAILPVLQTLVPEAMCRPLPEKDGALTDEAYHVCREQLLRSDRAAIGCGIGLGGDLLPVLRAFAEAACPVIWDADALNLLALHKEFLPLKPEDVITPHPGEASRLLGRDTALVLSDSLASLWDLHAACGCRVILKGARSLMTDGEHAAVQPTGTPALAKGGSGDILTGVLAGLLGRIPPNTEERPLRELQAAVMAHALAGKRACRLCGEDCVTPDDVIRCIRLAP